MENGYYLSTYVCIDRETNVLEIEMRHDQNVALWHYENNNLTLVYYWELERLTGLKHHAKSFYSEGDFKYFIGLLLNKLNLSYDDIIEVWSEPQYERYKDYLWYKEISYHNLAHAFSGFLQDTELFHQKKILVLSVDGGPDTLTLTKNSICFSAMYEEYGRILGAEKISSPGPLWSWAKKFFGLEEGSLMALMSASESRVFDKIISNEIPNITDVESGYASYMYLKRICDFVFSLDERQEGVKFNYYDSRFSQKENQISMAMKIIYDLSCKIMCKNIDCVIDKLNIIPQDTYLSITGGYGLNCPSNSYLLEKYQFAGFIEVPCVNDSGISLGVGLLECYMKNPAFSFSLRTPFYGNEIENFNTQFLDMQKEIIEITKASAEQFIEDISKDVIIWIDGKCELGPRALGHRSLLAMPTEEMKERLNQIKGRQWWRPVAPIILEEAASEWFCQCNISRFMLKTYEIKKDKLCAVEGICHLDNSARVQTVGYEDNPVLYELLQSLYRKTGIPILGNTSLNDRGEPMINSAERVVEFAICKKISVVYINGMRCKINLKRKEIVKSNKEESEFKRVFNCQYREKEAEKINPYHLDKNELYFYYNSLFSRGVDLTKERDAKVIKRMYHQKLGKLLEETGDF